MDALRRRHPCTAHRTRSWRARRRDPPSLGAQQRPRADLRRPCRGRAAVLCGRTLARATAHRRPHAPQRLAPALRYRVCRGAQWCATTSLYHREHGGAAAYGRPAAEQLAADVGRERPIERGVGQAVAQGSQNEQLPIRQLQDRRTRAVRLEERPLRAEQHVRNRPAEDHAATRSATRCAQAVLRCGMSRRGGQLTACSKMALFTQVPRRGILRSWTSVLRRSRKYVSSMLHRSGWLAVPKASASWRIVLSAYRFNRHDPADIYKRRKVGSWRTRR